MIHASLNFTFITLIPKEYNPLNFVYFRPISLCNYLYKISSKVIAKRIKDILSINISKEQFGFLEGQQIHEAIGVAQEGLHSMKAKDIKGLVIKLDISKSYDWVNSLYIRMLLTHLGFGITFIRWIMCFLTLVFFSLLINGETSPIFHHERGLRQGCLVSPLLLLLVAKRLSRFLKHASKTWGYKGTPIS